MSDPTTQKFDPRAPVERVNVETLREWGVAVLSEEGQPIDGDAELAPGVRGYAMVVDGALYIPWIEAVTEGRGYVARFLDQLPKDKTIKVPTIISHRLLGMLKRRGYVSAHETDPHNGEIVAVMVRAAFTASRGAPEDAGDARA